METFFFNREDITFLQSCDSRLRVFSALSLECVKTDGGRKILVDCFCIKHMYLSMMLFQYVSGLTKYRFVRYSGHCDFFSKKVPWK